MTKEELLTILDAVPDGTEVRIQPTPHPITRRVDLACVRYAHGDPPVVVLVNAHH